MAKYRKRPTVVDAVQWTGDNLREVIGLIGLHPSVENLTWAEYEAYVRVKGLKIFTLEGVKPVAVGEYILVGSGGKPYSFTPEDFFALYEPL